MFKNTVLIITQDVNNNSKNEENKVAKSVSIVPENSKLI